MKRCTLLLVVSSVLFLPGCSSTGKDVGGRILRDVLGESTGGSGLGSGGDAVELRGPDRVGRGEAFVVEVHADVGTNDLAAYAFTLTWADSIEVLAVRAGTSRLGPPLAVNLGRDEVRFNGISVMRGASGVVHVANLECVARRRGTARISEDRRPGDTLSIYPPGGGTATEEVPGWRLTAFQAPID